MHMSHKFGTGVMGIFSHICQNFQMFVETLIAFYLHMQFSNCSAVGDPFRARSPNNIKIIHDNIAR